MGSAKFRFAYGCSADTEDEATTILITASGINPRERGSLGGVLGRGGGIAGSQKIHYLIYITRLARHNSAGHHSIIASAVIAVTGNGP